MVCSFAWLGSSCCFSTEGWREGWREGGAREGEERSAAPSGRISKLESTFLCHFISYLVLPLCSSIIVVQDFMINQILCGDSSLAPPSLPPSLSSSLWISPLSRYASDDSSLRARGTKRQEMLLFLFAPLRKNRYGKTNTNADDPVVAFSSFHLSTAYPAGSRGKRRGGGGTLG